MKKESRDWGGIIGMTMLAFVFLGPILLHVPDRLIKNKGYWVTDPLVYILLEEGGGGMLLWEDDGLIAYG